MTLFSQVRKVRHRRLDYVAQGHLARVWLWQVCEVGQSALGSALTMGNSASRAAV